MGGYYHIADKSPHFVDVKMLTGGNQGNVQYGICKVKEHISQYDNI